MSTTFNSPEAFFSMWWSFALNPSEDEVAGGTETAGSRIHGAEDDDVAGAGAATDGAAEKLLSAECAGAVADAKKICAEGLRWHAPRGPQQAPRAARRRDWALRARVLCGTRRN